MPPQSGYRFSDEVMLKQKSTRRKNEWLKWQG